MTEKKQLTISFSGGAGSGKTIASVLMLAWLHSQGVEAEILNGPASEGMNPKSTGLLLQYLRENVKITLVDYRT